MNAQHVVYSVCLNDGCINKHKYQIALTRDNLAFCKCKKKLRWFCVSCSKILTYQQFKKIHDLNTCNLERNNALTKVSIVNTFINK